MKTKHEHIVEVLKKHQEPSGYSPDSSMKTLPFVPFWNYDKAAIEIEKLFEPEEKLSEEDEIMNNHEIEEYLQEWLFNYDLQSKADFSYAELHQLVKDLLNHLNK